MVVGSFQHSGSTDGIHASEIDGALAEKAGTTGNMVAEDSDGIADGSGEFGFGGAEDRHGFGAESGRHMHGATVIAENKRGVGDAVKELCEGGLAAEIGRINTRFFQKTGQCFSDRDVSNTAENYNLELVPGAQFCGHGGVAVNVPAFGGTIFRARTDDETGVGIRGCGRTG